MAQNKRLNEQRRMAFSGNVQRLRKHKYLTIQKLHELTDIDYQRLRRWVTDGVAHVTSRTKADLIKLANELGLADAELLWANPESAIKSDFLDQFNQAYGSSKQFGILELEGEEIISSMAAFIADVATRSKPRPSSPVKWTGSKRQQTRRVLKHFPRKIQTYYEPFIGGASVLLALLDSEIEVETFRCSDTNERLIDIWNLIKEAPDDLIESYTQLWKKLQREGSDFYYSTRFAFNADHDPRKLFFLMRTCRMMRYNDAGEFNAGFRHRRGGIHPDKLSFDVKHFSKKLRAHDVEFEVKDYRDVRTQVGDFVYLDPPYESAHMNYYGGAFDYPALWNWLEQLPCRFALSFDNNIPSHLYSDSYPISEHRTDKLYVSVKAVATASPSSEPRMISQQADAQHRNSSGVEPEMKQGKKSGGTPSGVEEDLTKFIQNRIKERSRSEGRLNRTRALGDMDTAEATQSLIYFTKVYQSEGMSLTAAIDRAIDAQFLGD